MNKYTIEHREFGTLIFGGVPTDDLIGISKILSAYEYDIVDGWLSQKLGASFCFTNKKKSSQWRKELGYDDSFSA